MAAARPSARVGSPGGFVRRYRASGSPGRKRSNTAHESIVVESRQTGIESAVVFAMRRHASDEAANSQMIDELALRKSRKLGGDETGLTLREKLPSIARDTRHDSDEHINA
jgi:hypothetical protein